MPQLISRPMQMSALLSSGTKGNSPDLRLVPNGSLGEGLLDDTEVPEILALCCLCLKHSRFLKFLHAV